jgi:hypothetical protein
VPASLGSTRTIYALFYEVIHNAQIFLVTDEIAKRETKWDAHSFHLDDHRKMIRRHHHCSRKADQVGPTYFLIPSSLLHETCTRHANTHAHTDRQARAFTVRDLTKYLYTCVHSTMDRVSPLDRDYGGRDTFR